MNKKLILFGSMLAVVILILVSFNSVVSIQASKPESKTVASPLFSIRTRRALKQESRDDLTCNYVGKDRGITIPLPTRDDRTAQVQKFIDKISRMDDASFNRFMGLAVSRLRNNNQAKEEDILKIKEAFQYIRDNPDEVKNLIADVKDYDDIAKGEFTVGPGDHVICLVMGAIMIVVIALFASASVTVMFTDIVSTLGEGWRPGCAVDAIKEWIAFSIAISLFFSGLMLVGVLGVLIYLCC